MSVLTTLSLPDKKTSDTRLMERMCHKNQDKDTNLALSKEQAWMENVYQHCFGWKRRWEKTLQTLLLTKNVSYRGQEIFLDEDKLCVFIGHNMNFVDLQKPFQLTSLEKKLLFFLCHKDIADLAQTLLAPSLQDEATLNHLTNVLLTQWPTDQAWKDQVLALARYSNQAKPSLIKDLPQGRYLPRLLSERKEALVLLKNGKTWETRNGAKLDVTLSKSHPKRREVLEVLTHIPMLERIELPFSTSFEDLLPIVQDIAKVLRGNHALVKKAKREKRTWKMAMRRIQGMGLNGCFDVATQTIIADPRHMESLKHELCHWLLGHGIGFQVSQEFHAKEHLVHRLERELFN